MPEFLKTVPWSQKMLNQFIRSTLLRAILISRDTKGIYGCIYLWNYQGIVKAIVPTLQNGQ